MIKGIIFDLNGTLIDISTDEWSDEVYRTTAHFLGYSGVLISPEELRENYFALNKEQRRRSPEAFPEFDAVKIFHDIIMKKVPMTENNAGKIAVSTAQVYRAAALKKLQLYPGVKEVLTDLKSRFKLAAVSDGQSAWALPELYMAGLNEFFSGATVSGDFGFRKPDKRMYEYALEKLDLKPEEVVFIGNDMYRDIYGAKNAGMKTVFFKSNQGDHSPGGAEPDYIIYKFDELMRAIAFLEEKEKNDFEKIYMVYVSSLFSVSFFRL